MPRLRNGDYPSLGQYRDGYMLVCHGDDQPSQWVSWLEPMVSNFNELAELADEYQIGGRSVDCRRWPGSVLEFCEHIGIDMQRSAWEGSLVSGVYWLGWLKRGTLRKVKSQARKLVDDMRRHLETEIRRKVLDDLRGIRDFQTFLERTRDHRDQLQQRIAELESSGSTLRLEVARLASRVKELTNLDTRLIDQACLRLACAVLERSRSRVIAGPIILWDDGNAYAIVSCGGVSIPPDSAPDLLLKSLIRCGHPVVCVRESTRVGAWISGPVYKKGSHRINDWAHIWTEQYTHRRIFETENSELTERVHEIHRQLAAEIR